MAAEKSNVSNVAAVPLVWDEDDEGLSQECKDLIANLPAEPTLLMNKLYQYQGVWLTKKITQAILNCQNNFQALDSDVILVSSPKSGSTWFKALTFAILNRKTHLPNPTQMSSTHPLLTANPHALVRTLETVVYNGQAEPDLSFSHHQGFFDSYAICFVAGVHQVVAMQDSVLVQKPKGPVRLFMAFHEQAKTRTPSGQHDRRFVRAILQRSEPLGAILGSHAGVLQGEFGEAK
ncbi:hypothetical protein K1719_022828 [Acacia pycnantha]|nr:hypothetical protein K1719_022828 [Acacia pycnantha]